MGFKLHRKSDIVAGAIGIGFMGVLLVLISLLGDRIPNVQFDVSGEIITREHPDFADYFRATRIGGGIAGVLCGLVSWLLFRYSRRVADS